MFDIGFSELLMFGAIALIVLGPEKLPHAARSAGKWYAKIRHAISSIQHEIENEFDLAEARRQMEEELEKIRNAEARMQQEMEELRDNMQEFQQQQEFNPSQRETLKNSDASLPNNHDKSSHSGKE